MTESYPRGPSREAVDALLAAAGVRADRVRAVRPLTGGTFNSVHRVELADRTDLVVKIAPDPARPIMRYERHILATEALYYRLADGLGLPVPRLLHSGTDGAAGDFLVMTARPGTPWHLVRDRLGGADPARLRAELGRAVAGLHTLTGTEFGYPNGTLGPLSPTWRDAFVGMMAALLADAEQYGSRLPRPVAEIRDVVADRAGALDEVTTPVLVHFDLWDGNILLDTDGGTPRIGGLIDAERAFWGDPLAELVSLALLGTIEDDEPFLAGYRSAGGRVTFDPPARTRLALYRAYLYLIMLVEAGPRGYDGARLRWLDEHVRPPLVTELDALTATPT